VTRFVGRRGELDVLHAGLDEAIRGRGQLHLLIGEPGIGKTRLGGELADAASDRGARVLWGRTWEGVGAPPFWPWIQILRAYLHAIDPGQIRDEVGAGAVYLAAIAPELAAALGRPSEHAADSGASRFLVYDAVTTLLRNAARKQPLVVMIDDLHWSDESSLALLRFFVREIADVPLLVIGTSRDADPRLIRLGNVIQLKGLLRAEVAEYIEELGVAADSDAVDEVANITAGNPCLIDLCARDMSALRSGARDVVAQRVQQLPEGAQGVLETGSVIGREFMLGMIETATGRPRDELLPIFAEAARVGILEVEGLALGAYAFSHALFREAFYSGIAAQDLPGVHHRVGIALETFYGANRDAHIAELAPHFILAAPVDGDAAVMHATQAAFAARQRFALAESQDLLDQARDLVGFTSEPDRNRCTILIAIGDIQMRNADYEASAATFTEAAHLARAVGDPELLGRAAVGIVDASLDVSMFVADVEALALLRESLAAIPDHNHRLRVRVLGNLARAQLLDAPPEETIALARESVRIATESDERGLLLLALSDLWWTLLGAEHFSERMEVSRRIVTEARALSEQRLLLSGLGYQLVDLLQAGDIRALDDAFVAFETCWERVRAPGYRWIVAGHHVMRALLDGRFDEATDAIGDVDNGLFAPWFEYLLAWERGSPGAIEDALRRVGPIADLLPHARSAAVASALAEAGKLDEVKAIVDAIDPDEFARIPQGLSWCGTIACYANACSVLGDAVRSEALYRLLEPFADQQMSLVFIGALPSAALFLAQLAVTCERNDDALRHFEMALRQHERMDARPFIARTSCEFGRFLVEHGDPERGTRLLRASLGMSMELGMEAVRRRAESALTDAGSAPSDETQAGRVEAILRRTGEVWSVGHGARIVSLKDSKGLRALHRLLSSPGVEVHAAELSAFVEGNVSGASSVAAEDGLSMSDDDAGPMLDEAAKAAYRARLGELREVVDEADAWNDSARAENAREEMQMLTEELSRGFGLGGRARKASSTAERARINISKAVKRALDAVSAHDPDLGRHLRTYVRTGVFCVYDPDPLSPVVWSL
jgi:hypothetical protein